MKDIVLFGIQWSGKGTQAHMLADVLAAQYTHYSPGEAFMTLTMTDNPIGNYLKDRLAVWDLLDDMVVNGMFAIYLYGVTDEGKSMMIDGYPRTLGQMQYMMWACKSRGRDMVAIYLTLPTEVAIERIHARGRSDDTEAAIAHRLEQYFAITFPLLDERKKHYPLITIDAQGSVEEIHAEIMRQLEIS